MFDLFGIIDVFSFKLTVFTNHSIFGKHERIYPSYIRIIDLRIKSKPAHQVPIKFEFVGEFFLEINKSLLMLLLIFLEFLHITEVQLLK